MWGILGFGCLNDAQISWLLKPWQHLQLAKIILTLLASVSLMFLLLCEINVTVLVSNYTTFNSVENILLSLGGQMVHQNE